MEDPVVESDSDCSILNVTPGKRGKREGPGGTRHDGGKVVQFERSKEAFPAPDSRHFMNEPEVSLPTTVVDGVAVAIATGIAEFLHSWRVVNDGSRLTPFLGLAEFRR